MTIIIISCFIIKFIIVATFYAIIHLNNLFQLPSMVDYKQLLNGSPQLLKSKFKLTFNLILNMLNVNSRDNNTMDNHVNNIKKQISFASKSMITNDIDNERNSIIEHINNAVEKIDERKTNVTYSKIKENLYLYEKYNQLTKDLQNSSNKKRKNIQREMENIKSSDKHFQKSFDSYASILEDEVNIEKNKEYLMSLEHYFENQTNDIIDYLTFHKYVDAQQNITTPTLEHTTLAIRQSKGGLYSFGKNLIDSINVSSLTDGEKALFITRVEESKTAINDYIAFLKNKKDMLETTGTAKNFRIGKDVFAKKFELDINTDYTAEEIYTKALKLKLKSI